MCWESFAGNDCLESGAHEYHQRRVSSSVMLCQDFTAADFSCCLFVGLSAFSFVFRKWNACSIGLKSGDWLGHCRIFPFFNLQKLLGCFCCMFWVIVHLYYEAPPNKLSSIWPNLGREYIHIHFRNHPAASVLSLMKTSNPVPLDAMHAHVITLLVSQMMLYALDHELYHTFFLPVILLSVDQV